MENTPTDVFYTVAEVALLLKKSRSWLYRAAKRGAITVSRVGSTLRIARAEVRRLLRPANEERVEAWTVEELRRKELKRDQATIKSLRASSRWTPPR